MSSICRCLFGLNQSTAHTPNEQFGHKEVPPSKQKFGILFFSLRFGLWTLFLPGKV